jgi:cation:H+ antiporter
MALRHKIAILSAFSLTAPWLISKYIALEFDSPVTALLSGSCVIGSAFLLAWACETAEMDVPRSFAIAIAALIAVLPEYAVDGYLAWMAAKNPEYISYAVANMTGANRLLIGIGWSSIIIYALWRFKAREVRLDESLQKEMFFLLIATLYAFILPLKKQIDIFDAIVFISIYIAYIYSCIKSPANEFEVAGVAAYLCSLSVKMRRAAVIILILFSASAILISVEAFADSLIETGKIAGLEPFLMIQWVAPLASEAPELVIAFIFVANLKYNHGINMLISSKVNQWTLLIASIPLIYSVSSGSISSLHLDVRQTHEVILTAAQSIFAVSILLNFRFSLSKALLILSLFTIQFALPNDEVRMAVSIAYIVICIPAFLIYRNEFWKGLRSMNFFT